METILATAFGHRVDILRGESDELSKSINLLLRDSNEKEVFNFFVLLSKFYSNCQGIIQPLIGIAFWLGHIVLLTIQCTMIFNCSQGYVPISSSAFCWD